MFDSESLEYRREMRKEQKRKHDRNKRLVHVVSLFLASIFIISSLFGISYLLDYS